MSKDLVQCCFLYDFKVGLSEAASSRRIFQVFGDGTVNERTTRHWFKKFRSGDLSLCDEPRSRRPHALDDGACRLLLRRILVQRVVNL
ncbi:histone-lysine N-methyltransferase SETMAR [Nephila pilipes]|uniref:Histone-lysine N-methyltransferase SETMAR n=1 Tax=Nephila pilipes TaxID=299642 RepID=A0A8X6I6D4_NEPPI|nr:histone-lysine N-methyltransferase SETMAR [Nephila pilipes]